MHNTDTATQVPDMLKPAQLIPVSQWVYDLYKVTYWTDDPDAGGREIRSIHIASSSENHLGADAWHNAPSQAEFMTYTVVKEDVGHPRVVGTMYGVAVHEAGNVHGQRLAEQM